MKGTLCLCLVCLLISPLTISSQLPDPCVPSVKQLRVSNIELNEAKKDVAEYHSLIAISHDLQTVLDLKLQHMEKKYVDRVHDLKLQEAIKEMEQQLFKKLKELK